MVWLMQERIIELNSSNLLIDNLRFYLLPYVELTIIDYANLWIAKNQLPRETGSKNYVKLKDFESLILNRKRNLVSAAELLYGVTDSTTVENADSIFNSVQSLLKNIIKISIV